MTSAARLATALAATLSAAGPVAAQGVDPPRLTHVFTLNVEVAPAEERGIVDGRRLRFVPITGGTVRGRRLTGVVLPGGGDWQAIHADGLTEIDTRYAIRAADGTVVEVRNTGVRVASAAVSDRIARGEAVAPSDYYFRTAPRFTVPDGPHGWLRRTQFVARGVRRPDDVEIQVFAVE